MLGDLALLQALVDPSNVLPQRGVVVILDAVVGPTSCQSLIQYTYLPSSSLAMSAHLLP